MSASKTPRYKSFRLDLTRARIGEELECAGEVLQVIDSYHMSDYADIAFGSPSEGRIRFQRGKLIHIPFDQIYFWNPVIANGWLDVLIGSNYAIQMQGVVDQTIAELLSRCQDHLSGRIVVPAVPALAVELIPARADRRMLILQAEAVAVVVGSQAELNAAALNGIELPIAPGPPYGFLPVENWASNLYVRMSAGGPVAVRWLEGW